MYNSLRSQQDTEPDEDWHGTCFALPVSQTHCQSTSVTRSGCEQKDAPNTVSLYTIKNSPNRQHQKTNIELGFWWPATVESDLTAFVSPQLLGYTVTCLIELQLSLNTDFIYSTYTQNIHRAAYVYLRGFMFVHYITDYMNTQNICFRT